MNKDFLITYCFEKFSFTKCIGKFFTGSNVSYAVYLLLHAGEDEGHGPAGVRRRHRGAVHELGAAQRELPHGGDGAAGGAQRQPPVPVNSRSAGAPRELGPCGYTMLKVTKIVK